MAGDTVARSVSKFIYIRVGGQIRWIYPPLNKPKTLGAIARQQQQDIKLTIILKLNKMNTCTKILSCFLVASILQSCGSRSTESATESLPENTDSAFADELPEETEETIAFDNYLEEEYSAVLEDDLFLEPTLYLSEIRDFEIENISNLLNTLTNDIAKDIDEYNMDILKRLQSQIVYDRINGEFRGNAKLTPSEFKMFKDFLLKTITYFRLTSEIKVKLIKKHESNLDQTELTKFKELYLRTETNFNEFMLELINSIDIAYSSRRSINSYIFQEKYNRCINSYIDFIKTDVNLSYTSQTVYQFASLTQENNLQKMKDELDLIIKKYQIEEYTRKFKKMDLDLAVGLFGFVNTVIKFFKDRHETKINILKDEIKLYKFYSWDRI